MRIKDVEIRVATAEDIREFYPDGSPRTAYCWVALYKGVPSCLAGLTVGRGGCVAFSEVKPDCDAPKITIWRTARELFGKIVQLDLPMSAACEPADRMAQKFVESLGFVRQERKYQGMEMFIWQK